MGHSSDAHAATAGVRGDGFAPGPRPAVGHMPFDGHSTVAENWDRQERDAQLPWCPPEHRPLYRKIRGAGFTGVEARRIVSDHIAADLRRTLGR